MKTLAKRIRTLTCLFLALLLLLSVFPLSASALSNRDVYLYLGDEALTGEEEEMFYIIDDSLSFKIDDASSLDEQLSDYVYIEGGDLAGWNLWCYEGGSFEVLSAKKIGSFPVDMKISDLDAASLEEIEKPIYDLVIEPVINVKYLFTHQPTAEHPYITTNVAAEGYQWYEYGIMDVKKALRDDVIVPEETPTEYPVFVYCGEDLDNGLWHSDDYASDGNAIDFSFTLDSGDSISITIKTQGFDGFVEDYDDVVTLTKNGDVYTFVNEDDYENNYNFWIYGATAPFEAELFITRNDIFAEVGEISGQTSAAYTESPNKTVACKASFEDGKYVITSETVELEDYWVVAQPTSDNPTFKVNAPDDVNSYQWYSYSTELKAFIFGGDNATGDNEIATTAIDTEDELNDLLGSSGDIEKFIGVTVGSYQGEGWWKTVSFGTGKLFGQYLKVTPGDKVKVELKDPTAQGEIKPEDYGMVIQAYRIDQTKRPIQVSLAEDGTVTAPEGYDALMFSFTENPQGTIYALRTALATGNLQVRLSHTKEAEILTAVEGQTSATFTGKYGTYIVKATMEDGTVIRSNPVQAGVLPNTGAPGGPGTPAPSIPNTSDGTAALAWAIIGMLCAASMVATTLLRKKVIAEN